MPKVNHLNPESDLIENDAQYEIVSLRRSERRGTGPLDIKSEFFVEENAINVEEVDKQYVDIVGEGERRESGSGRRTSRPKLLNVDEVATLRRK